MTSTPEPPPPTPDAARGVFGSTRLPLAERYAELLASDGVVRGLIGPREAPRLWDRHLLNCAVLGEVIPEASAVCDVGSGAGLPGLVLAIARPDLSITLVEPLLRRTTFLEEVVEELSLSNVTIKRGRAEDLAERHSFDVVTSRAVAPLDRLLRWSMPLVAPGGALVAMKGSSVSEEINASRRTLRELGCAEPEILVLGGEPPLHSTQALRVAWADPSRVGLRTSRSTRSLKRRRR